MQVERVTSSCSLEKHTCNRPARAGYAHPKSPQVSVGCHLTKQWVPSDAVTWSGPNRGAGPGAGGPPSVLSVRCTGFCAESDGALTGYRLWSLSTSQEQDPRYDTEIPGLMVALTQTRALPAPSRRASLGSSSRSSARRGGCTETVLHTLKANKSNFKNEPKTSQNKACLLM